MLKVDAIGGCRTKAETLPELVSAIGDYSVETSVLRLDQRLFDQASPYPSALLVRVNGDGTDPADPNRIGVG
jgi:hypothetical protein